MALSRTVDQLTPRSPFDNHFATQKDVYFDYTVGNEETGATYPPDHEGALDSVRVLAPSNWVGAANSKQSCGKKSSERTRAVLFLNFLLIINK